MAEIIYLVGTFHLIAIILNGLRRLRTWQASHPYIAIIIDSPSDREATLLYEEYP